MERDAIQEMIDCCNTFTNLYKNILAMKDNKNLNKEELKIIGYMEVFEDHYVIRIDNFKTLLERGK